MTDAANETGRQSRLRNGQLRQRVLDALGDGGWRLASELARACALPPRYGLGYLRRLMRQGWLEAGIGQDGSRTLGPAYRLSAMACRRQLAREWGLRQAQQASGPDLPSGDHVPPQQTV